ncbi:hypothetical protein BVY01_04340 [bacterium I07]|nr:hypothetical protein BVY01_04340 [bacterium I07]
MNRRRFIKTAAAGTFAANIITCKKHRSKPNLLFIWTDEQRPDTMAVYGNTRIQAPNLNKLAEESVVFRNAYVSQPVCTPSRSTVMTGLWPHTSGCTENNLPLPPDVRVFPELLDDPEYRTGYVGKWHLGDEIFAQHGFEEWVSMEDGYSRYYRKDRDRTERSSYHHFLIESGYRPDRISSNTFSRSYAARLPIEYCKPRFLEMQAVDFLNRHKNEPFTLYVNFLEPHPPFFGPLNNEHKLSDIEFPANYNDPLEDNEPLWYRIRQNMGIENKKGEFDLTRDEGWRRLIANYWGLVTQMDRSVGAILTALENLGLADNTIVVFTSDHGDMMGSHRLLNKSVMYQESVQVPWLMRIPDMGKGQHIVNQHVSHIDLVPTLLDLMNTHSDPDLPGRSLRPMIDEGSAGEDVFTEWTPNIHRYRPLTKSYLPGVTVEETNKVMQANRRAVISQDGMKLVLADNDLDQLYDLNKDPFETTNLINENHYKEIILANSKKIADWQRRVDDTVEVL